MSRLTDPPRPRHLIINADDLGICPSRDKGILSLYQTGAISSASLLVDGAHAEEASGEAVRLGLPLGLHLNLSEGAAPPDSSLADPSGRLRGKDGLRAALADGSISGHDLAAAIRAQFNRFIALTGELPSHVDGHHHIHVELPVARILAPIMAREYGVYCVRIPCEQPIPRHTPVPEDDEDGFHRQVCRAAALALPLFAAENIYTTDAFIGQDFMGERLQAEGLTRAIRCMNATDPRGLWLELMVHPGIPADANEGSEFCRLPARAHEMAVLQSREWQEAIRGWSLSSYREMPRPHENDKPTLLIYSKLAPATGNAETARRYGAAWAEQANIRFRPLPPDTSPVATECRRLREFARRERLDLAFGIHIHHAGIPLAAAFADDPAHSLPFGLLASGTDANADVAIPERRARMATLLQQADFLVCLTDDLHRRLADLPLPEETIIEPNGIDISTDSTCSLRALLKIPRERQLIVFPASLRRLKGVLPCIESLAEPLTTRWTSHVLIVLGPALEADYAAEITQGIAALTTRHPGLSGRLLLHPGLPHADYLAALREASLVLNASEHEGLSHALAEAMAAGIPVLARDIPGNRQLVRHNENGRLFADFSTLPGVYASCFDAPDETAKMAADARSEIARRFPLQAEQKTLRAILARALQRRA